MDEAEEDKKDQEDQRDDHAPNQQLVTSPLSSHLLLKLLIGLLDVLLGLAQVSIDLLQLGALYLHLVLDVACDVPHVPHHCGY